MAKQSIQTSSAQPGTFDSNLNEDNKGFGKRPNEWTQARNAVNNTVVGDIGDISNEAANYLAVEVPYTIIGRIHVGADAWAVFSTNNVDSEIGLFKEEQRSYKTIVNSTLLNFNTDNLIKGIGRTAHDCGRQLYWDDGVNPTRVLDIDDVPWKQSCTDDNGCKVCVDTGILDIERLRLSPLIGNLSFRVAEGNSSGQILNGSYYVVGAYLIEGQRITDYSLPSNVQALFHHDNMASSLDIFVEEADPDFDEFELVLVQFANYNTVAKRVGVYSTRQRKITLDTIDEHWEDVDPSLILINNAIPEKSNGVYRNGEYALRVGPVDKFDFNYQPLANQIETQWVSIEYNADYYRKGGSNTGYMRDEIYSFFLRWVWNTGDKSRSFHIPGRAMQTNLSIDGNLVGDNSPVVTSDDLLPGEDAVYWKVYNTATIDTTFIPSSPGVDDTGDGGRIIARGKMGYWESTEKYDDDKPQIWNTKSDPNWGGKGNPVYDLCGKHIRHHKFPANDLQNTNIPDITNSLRYPANHYDPIDGSKIRVMGVQFSNIKPPLDNEGNVIEGIVGYEILRGSREGNKTVLAKGMVNNMRQYNPEDSTDRQYLYPNYPYNAKDCFDRTPEKGFKEANGNVKLGVDRFLSSMSTKYNKNTNDYGALLETDVPLGIDSMPFPDSENLVGNIRTDFLTFHSPETNFRNPFLSGKELRVYGELTGTMEGQFQFPKDHPRHKFLKDTAFLLSTIMGIGYASVKTKGVTTRTHKDPDIDYGGTKTDVGTSSGTTGMAGPSLPASLLQSGNVSISQVLSAAMDSLKDSIFSVVTSITGIDPYGITENARTVSGMITGTMGGRGGADSYAHEDTAWSSVPGILRSIQGTPTYLSFWAEGIDQMLEVIYAFTPYKQYALQQISHGYYNKFFGVSIGTKRRAIKNQTYLNPSLQDFGDFRINNIYRARTVALQLEDGLDLPKGIDNSQVLFSEIPGNSWNDVDMAKGFTANISSYYTAIKQRLDNQYGQLVGIRQVPITRTQINIDAPSSGVLFGGDIYIGRYTEKNTMFFFYDWLKGQPDGHSFNYALYKMVPHPRFWMDTNKYDTGELLDGLSALFNDKPPQSFEPFAINNKYGPEIKPVCGCQLPAGSVHTNRFEHCYANEYAGEEYLKNICTTQQKLNAEVAYRKWLEAAVCFANKVGEEENDPGGKAEPCDGCNMEEEPFIKITKSILDDGTTQIIYESSFLDDVEYVYDNLRNSEGKKASPVLDERTSDRVYDWAHDEFTRKQFAKWHCEEKGKIKRWINKADKKIERAQKKYDKAVKKLYDAYVDNITNDNGKGSKWSTFFNEKFNTPNDKFAFDMKSYSGNKFFQLRVKDAFMYLFNSGVRDFFVESEINVDLRDWGETLDERHYDHLEYTNLTELFSTDRIKIGNYMKYDYSLSVSKLFNNFLSWAQVQDRDYDPYIAETCYTARPKRLIYSLPQSLENKKDHWRVFLPLNYKDLNSVPTAIKPIGKNGALMLLENESPVLLPGKEELQLDSDTKIVIGDGGLFAKPFQNLVNSEYPNEYGSCQNSWAVANTPAGIFYMSQNQGKIFQVAGSSSLREISSDNMKWWFSRYLPYKLTQHPTAFRNPDGTYNSFELSDNPVTGIGCQVIYDNLNQIVFFCKKDWMIREDIADTVTYESGDTFLVNNMLRVKLGDPKYFRSASWTVSWDPKAGGDRGAWLAYHDWHPDLTIPSKHTYMSTKDNGIWIHADRCDLYCNYYGVDYPFEIEYTLHTTEGVNTLRNVMYLMEAYVYADNCDDRFHVLDENFDEAIVYNSEQCSGLLKLNLMPKNNAPLINTFPRINFDSIDILFSKEEQKYRFNQFWDITDDRGEFNSLAQRTIFLTEPNGYIKNLNANNLNYNKNALEHKKFRHYKHTVLLRKNVCGNKNFVVSLAVQLNLNSPR